MRIFALVALLVVVCCAGAMALENLNSATGYVLVPDASTAPAGQWQYSLAYVAPRGTNELSKLGPALICDGNGFNARALYGLPGGKAEAGIGYMNISKSAGDAHAFSLALKLHVYDKPEDMESFAAGMMYRAWSTDMSVEHGSFTLDADIPNVTSFYVVMDKKWPGANNTWTTSIGLTWDNYSKTTQGFESSIVPFGIVGRPATPFVAFGPVHADGSIDSNGFLRPFLGASMTAGDWTFLFDYKPEAESGGFKYQDTLWSLAARRAVNSNLKATAGFTTFNIPYTSSDPGFFLDLTYTK